MAYNPGSSLWNPLIIGTIVVILALAAFLVLRGSDSSQQAGIERLPPPATSPAPSPTAPPAKPQN